MFGLDKNISPDKSWSLFLDRDGVINTRLIGDYIKTPDEFELISGVIESLQRFQEIFGRIFIVTNQQGIGKGLMTEDDLKAVHNKMLNLFRNHQITIDQIYYCPHLASDDCHCRKPQPGMGIRAQQEFPNVNFSKSLMIGDSPSDIEFGKNLGMQTLFISEGKRLIDLFALS